MVFQKAISRLQNLASRKAKNASKKDDAARGETQTARGGHENIQFNVDAETVTEQQANSCEQRQIKKRTSQESEEEIEPEDVLNLMFDYFDKKIETMQTQIDKNMEPPAKKYKPDGHDIKGKGNRDQFDFDIEISFAIQECEQQISRGNIEDLSANLTSIATKLRKRNKLIKLADRLPAEWSIVQEYEQDPMARDSDDAQKLDRQNKGQSEKRK